jgi:hypothetical protein
VQGTAVIKLPFPLSREELSSENPFWVKVCQVSVHMQSCFSCWYYKNFLPSFLSLLPRSIFFLFDAILQSKQVYFCCCLLLRSPPPPPPPSPPLPPPPKQRMALSSPFSSAATKRFSKGDTFKLNSSEIMTCFALNQKCGTKCICHDKICRTLILSEEKLLCKSRSVRP